jgi:hypothetical protein
MTGFDFGVDSLCRYITSHGSSSHAKYLTSTNTSDERIIEVVSVTRALGNEHVG